MTRPSLAGIEQRAAAATPGPWEVIGGGEYVSGPDIVVAPDDGGVTPADAAFIAHARTGLPALTAAVRDVLAVADDLDAMPADATLRTCDVADLIRNAVRNHLDLTDPEGDST